MFKHFKKTFADKPSAIEEICLKSGDIIKIKPDGLLIRSNFIYEEYMPFLYSRFCSSARFELNASDLEYIEQLKDVATYMGIDSNIVEMLIDEGYDFFEIEDIIYNGTFEEPEVTFESCHNV